MGLSVILVWKNHIYVFMSFMERNWVVCICGIVRE